MRRTKFTSVIAVMPVSDYQASLAWYSKFLGAPDVEPEEGTGEWSVTDGAWLQIGTEPENAGRSSFILGVDDVAAQREACEEAGVTVGEVVDYGFVKLAEALDPDGNKVVFVEETEPAES